MLITVFNTTFNVVCQCKVCLCKQRAVTYQNILINVNDTYNYEVNVHTWLDEGTVREAIYIEDRALCSM